LPIRIACVTIPGVTRNQIILITAALAAGLGLGLYIGWVAAPVQFTNTEPGSLAPAFKDDYILMVATAFSGDGDLAAAQAQLAAMGQLSPEAVRAASQRLAAAGLPEADQQRLEGLAAALTSPGAATVSPTPG
jgi:hypothetical protein